jgi:hypothetical protein
VTNTKRKNATNRNQSTLVESAKARKSKPKNVRRTITEPRQYHAALILHREDPAQLSQVLYASIIAFRAITPERLARVSYDGLQILKDFATEAARARELTERRMFELMTKEMQPPRKIKLPRAARPTADNVYLQAEASSQRESG